MISYVNLIENLRRRFPRVIDTKWLPFRVRGVTVDNR